MRVYRRTWADASGRKQRSPDYTAEFWHRGKRVRKSTKARDRRTAEQIARRMREDHARADAGLVPQETPDATTVYQHLDRWVSHMEARRLSPKYVKRSREWVDEYLTESGIVRLVDMSKSNALEWIASKPASAATFNRRRAALRAFANWATNQELLPANPLRGLEAWNESEDRRYERDALSLDELTALLNDSRIPLYRRAAYCLAAATGIRRHELEMLEWHRIDLDAAAFLVRASTAKNSQDAWLPLAPMCVSLLRQWHEEGKSGGKIGNWRRHKRESGLDLVVPVPNVTTLAGDLARLGIGVPVYAEGHRGRKKRVIRVRRPTGEALDLHALRSTTATLALSSGASPAEVQALLRHSTFALTKKHYAKFALQHMRRAQDLLGLTADRVAGSVAGPAPSRANPAQVSTTQPQARRTRKAKAGKE